MAEVDDYALPAGLLRHFDLTSTPTISRRESYPGGLLFIDRLLAVAEIDGPALYPPTSPVGYRRLLHAIHSSPLDRLKKDCFYYYLLKDERQDDGDNSMEDKDGERSQRFAESRCLSRTWKGFMDGYWALDHGLWEDAITHLTNPLITSINFPSDIISTLSLLAPTTIALDLIHKFTLTRPPDLSTPETDLHLYTLSLASSQSISAAFSFIRTLPTEKQGGMRDGIWAWAFGAPKIPCGLGINKVNQIAIKEILHLPLLSHEDDQLLQFLLSPPRNISPESLSLLHDLVTLRLIHQGKYAESLQLDKELAGSGGSEENRQKRREMVREFISILPEAQRRVLAIDGEFIASRKERAEGAGNRNGNGYMELDGPINKSTNIATAAPTPIKPIPSFPLETTQTPSIPQKEKEKVATPSQSRVVSSTNSPFSGPPRFAPSNSTNTNSPQISRVLSGSPFTLPMSRGANAVRSASSTGIRTPTMGKRELPIPRPKVRAVVRDEEDDERPKTRKRARESDVDMEQEQAQEQGQITEIESVQENGNDNNDTEPADADTEMEMEVEKEQEIPQEPIVEKEPSPPAPTPRTRRTKPQPPPPSTTPKRSTRKSTLPPPSPLHARIPGSFDLSIPQSVPEDSTLQPRTRKSKTQTKPKETEVQAPRSRMTRSVSRAISLDMEASPPPAPSQAVKRARSRRASTATVASEVPEDVGRRGSPTPSTRSRVGSQTPRKSTRVRK